jgi:hypothetical protein
MRCMQNSLSSTNSFRKSIHCSLSSSSGSVIIIKVIQCLASPVEHVARLPSILFRSFAASLAYRL